MLFIDARQTFSQVDRAHREFMPAQIEFIANIVRLYRGREPETHERQRDDAEGAFPEGKVRRCGRAVQGDHASRRSRRRAGA